MSESDPFAGLTLEPPDDKNDTESNIGFAPDLDGVDSSGTFSDAVEPGAPLRRDDRAHNRPPSTGPRATSNRENVDDGAALYPRATRALIAMFGNGEDAAPHRRTDDVDDTRPTSPDGDRVAFNVSTTGAPILRKPAEVKKPRDKTPSERVTPQAGTEELMDLLVVGRNAEGADEAHFQFSDDVLSGMYLHVEKHDDGIFMRFTVKDDIDKRTLSAYVDDLVSRFEKRGSRVKGYAIEVRADDDDES